MDLGSGFGVHIVHSDRKEKIEPKQWVDLKEGFCLQFGNCNEWTVKWLDIIVVSSGLSSEQRKQLKQEMEKLGGHVLGAWQDDVTHLVVEKILLTQKVMQFYFFCNKCLQLFQIIFNYRCWMLCWL